MNFGIGISDAVTLTQLAVDLYQKGFRVAQAAPETFTHLLRELLVIKGILYKIDAKFAQDGRIRDESAVQALQLCEKALLDFRPIVNRYQRLASTDRNLRLRLRFPFAQADIEKARKEIQKTIPFLQLILTAEVALGDVEATAGSSDRADFVNEASRVAVASNPHTARISSSQRTVPLLNNESVSASLPWNDMQRVQTLDSNADLDLALAPAPMTPVSRLRSTSESVRYEPSHASSRVTDRSSKTSFDSAGHDRVPSVSGSVDPGDEGAPVAFPAYQPWYNTALQIQEKSNVPLEIEDIHSSSVLDDLGECRKLASLEPAFTKHRLLTKDLDLSNWLVRAAWWLLKSTTLKALVCDNSSRHRNRADASSKVSMEQVTVDFFKSCYIVKNIILAEVNVGTKITQIMWKTLQDVCTAIHDQLHDYEKSFAPEPATRHLDMGFSEPIFQGVEQDRFLGDAIDSLNSPRRWMIVDIEDAGSPREKGLFRTFVNARVGPREKRSKSHAAPYMLTLWCQDGRSELIVTLTNQRGTLNLERNLTKQDIERFDEFTRSEVDFEFDFPSQECLIQFVTPDDLTAFLNYPRSFFDKIANREAKAEELLAFREGLRTFSHRHTSHRPDPAASESNDAFATQSHTSCELSLYEMVPHDCWKTVRRLVVSSCTDSTQPWCHSYWLPLYGVHVHGEEKDVELRWSDCGHLVESSDGSYGKLYSYLHKPDHPNFTISTQFETVEAASEFRRAILQPWEIPFEFDNITIKENFLGSRTNTLEDIAPDQTAGAEQAAVWQPSRSLSIWTMKDLDETEPQEYLSIVSTEKKPDNSYVTFVYFVSRDFDVNFPEDTVEIQHVVVLPKLSVPTYVSNVVQARREPQENPRFARCDLKEYSAKFAFTGGEEMARFLKALTSWRLRFMGPIKTMQLGSGIHPFKQINLTVALWESPERRSVKQIRLAMRRAEEPRKKHDYLWTTVSVSSLGQCDEKKDSSKLVFKDVSVFQGDMLDIKDLKAALSNDQEEQHRKTTLTLIFSEQHAARKLDRAISRCLPDWLPNEAVMRRSRTSTTSDSRFSSDPYQTFG